MLKKKIVDIMRILRIIWLFGIVGGIQYVYYFEKNKKEIPCKKEIIKLKYDYQKLIVRTNDTDLALVESILVGKFINRKWQSEYIQVEDYVKNLVNRKEVIICDAGANVGLFSRLMLKKFHNVKIFAIEPEGNNYHILDVNTNSYPVEIFRGGVWSHDCKLEVKSRETGSWGFTVYESENGSINAISIMTLREKYNLKKIDLLKLDIEGSEYEVFSVQDLSWLELCDAIIVETHDHIVEGSDELVNKVLHDKGFSKYVFEENQLFIRKNRSIR